MNRRIVMAAVIAAAAALALFLFGLDRDSRRLKRNLAELCRLVAKPEAEPDLKALGRAQDIAAFFTPRPDVGFPPYLSSVVSRRELAQVVYGCRNMADTIEVEVYDLALTLAKDRRSAAMDLTAKGTARRGELTETDIRELHLEWARLEGHWLLDRVRVISTIQHPDVRL